MFGTHYLCSRAVCVPTLKRRLNIALQRDDGSSGVAGLAVLLVLDED